MRSTPGNFSKAQRGYLDHHIVDRRLERGHRLLGDVVLQFVQRVAHCNLGRQLGNGKARRLGRQRAGARDAGVHLDDHHAAAVRVDGKLDIAAARFYAHRAHDHPRLVAQSLILFVRQRLRRGDGPVVWKMLAELGNLVDRAEPNPAHQALAQLEEMGRLQAVITQNIDALHQRAGSREVVEFHGNGQRLVCMNCGRNYSKESVPLGVLLPVAPVGEY